MNNETVMRMASECFADPDGSLALLTPELSRFAALVAAAEREECARVCEEVTAAWTQHVYNEGVMDCVKAIRARGEV